MARILRWKEKLALGFVALFFSMGQAWLPGTRNPASRDQPRHSLLLARTNQNMAFALELTARKPYVRFIHASTAPVAMPPSAGAYVAMAGAAGAAGAAAAMAAESSCSACRTDTHTCCSVADTSCCDEYCEHCYDVQCTSLFSVGGPGGYTCYTCGHGTCGACGD